MRVAFASVALEATLRALIESKIDSKRQFHRTVKKCDSQLQLETAFKSEPRAPLGGRGGDKTIWSFIAGEAVAAAAAVLAGGEGDALHLIYVRTLGEVGEARTAHTRLPNH